jgi:hypothetical protein
MNNFDMILMLIIFIGIFVATIYLYVFFMKTVYYKSIKDKTGTKLVDAKVIKYKELWMKGGKIAYVPTYEYEYKGKTYKHRCLIERHNDDSLEGNMTIIEINIENPKVVYEVGSALFTPLMSVGISVFVFVILIMFGWFIRYLIWGIY